MFYLLITIALSMMGSVANAGTNPIPLTIHETMTGRTLGMRSELLEDETGQLTFAEVKDLTFYPSTTEFPNFGVTTSAFWSHFILLNPFESKRTLIIENHLIGPDQQSFFIVESDGNAFEKKADETVNFKIHEIQHRHPAIELTLMPGLTHIYLRTQNMTGNAHALLLWDPLSFQKHHSNDLFFLSLLFGILFAMGAYNLFLFLSLRRLDVFLYVIFNFSFIAWQATYTGVYTQFFPMDFLQNTIVDKIMLAFGQLSSVFALAYCCQFLRIWGTSRWVDDLCLGSIALGSFSLLTLFFDVIHLSALIIPIHVMLTTALITYLSIRACLRNYRPAYLFFGAWLSLIVGTAITIGSVLDLIPYQLNNEWAVFVGAAIESILLSVALGYKWSYAIKLDAEARKRGAILLRSLEDARTIQQALLPRLQQVPGVAIAASYRTAEQIGGDLYGYHYDAIHQTLFFYIGDVTGHGLPSALLSVAVAGALRSSLARADRQHESPAILLEWIAQDLNHMIRDMSTGKMHMTMCVCSINLMTLECYYLNAGHNAFYLISKGLARGVLRGGSPLGGTTDTNFGKQYLQLQSGDILFFYTDGLTENSGPRGEMLSARVLKNLLQGKSSAKEVTASVEAEGQKIWSDHPAQDDCTFVSIELKEVI